MSQEFRIDASRAANPLWPELRQHYMDRLAKLRMDNDDMGKDAIETAALRARIDEVKKFLALDAEQPMISVASIDSK